MPRELTLGEAKDRIEGVLKAAGIKVSLWACGVLDVEFPDGAKGVFDAPVIECDGLSHQRG